ncbi:MAG: NUDIX domain-containing protein [Bacilli bacterium]|nr:NUDIX domain-containing protein [Bacilli bacterium]
MEYLGIYDNDGKPTEKKIVRGDKSVILNENEHIAVSIIFIENDHGEFLIQKASKEKGSYFSSTGGHIDFGETPLSTIKREVEEELGVIVEDKEIRACGFFNNGKALIFLYYLKKNINLDEVTLQKEEVDYVQYMTVDEIKKLIEEDQMLKSHGLMFKEILKIKD